MYGKRNAIVFRRNRSCGNAVECALMRIFQLGKQQGAHVFVGVTRAVSDRTGAVMVP